MTGFARAEGRFGALGVVWQLKAVNHRFLELALRMPEGFAELEGMASKRLKQRLARGHVEGWLSVRTEGGAVGRLLLNEPLLNDLLGLEQRLREENRSLRRRPRLSLAELLQWPGMVSSRGPLVPERESSEGLNRAMLTVLDEALDRLVGVRTIEGQGLEAVMTQQLAHLSTALDQLSERMPLIRQRSVARLRGRLADLAAGEVVEERLAQEIALLLSRMDHAEEVDRLRIHIGEMPKIWREEGPAGRRLDFLCQEMQREANTLCAKSQDSELTRIGVDIKVVVEQLREQVQNIE